LNLVGVRKKEEIGRYLQGFKDSLFSDSKENPGRIIWLETKARELYTGNTPGAIKPPELKEFAKILIEIQLLKKNILKFKDDLQEK